MQLRRALRPRLTGFFGSMPCHVTEMETPQRSDFKASSMTTQTRPLPRSSRSRGVHDAHAAPRHVCTRPTPARRHPHLCASYQCRASPASKNNLVATASAGGVCCPMTAMRSTCRQIDQQYTDTDCSAVYPPGDKEIWCMHMVRSGVVYVRGASNHLTHMRGHHTRHPNHV